MSYRIYLSPPSQNGTEAKALQDVVSSNWLAPVGPMLDTFEKSLSEIHENRPVLGLNSGTAAIHLALGISIFLDFGSNSVEFLQADSMEARILQPLKGSRYYTHT